MGTPPQLPPPPPMQAPPPATATQIVGQQTAPSTSVPVVVPGAYVTATGRQTNSAAVISFITALVAPFGHFVAVGGITLIIVSLVTGHMALSEIKRTGESGAGFAVAGLIISYAHLVISALLLLFFFNVMIAIFGLLFHSMFFH